MKILLLFIMCRGKCGLIFIDLLNFGLFITCKLQGNPDFFHNLISSQASMCFRYYRRALSNWVLHNKCYFMCYVLGELHLKGLISLVLGKQSVCFPREGENPGGESPMERSGILIRKFQLNPVAWFQTEKD